MELEKPAVLALLFLAFVEVSAVHAAAQKVETGFLNRALVLDGAEYRYQAYVPREPPNGQSFSRCTARASTAMMAPDNCLFSANPSCY